MNDQDYVEFMKTEKGKRFNRWMWFGVVAIAGFPLWVGIAVLIGIAAT